MILIHNGKNIVNRYHGERPLMAKYHGDKLVWLKENDWRNQYQQVEYIESNGKQYINTGYVVNGNSRVELKVSYTSRESTQHNGMLIRETSLSRFYAGYYSTDNAFLLGIVGYTGMGEYDELIHTFVLDNSIKTGWFDSSYYVFNNPYQNKGLTFYIGAVNESGRTNYYCHEKIYSFNIKEGNNVIMNLVPVYRRKDGVAGMYDIVNKKFYKSETSTEFNAGKEIVGRLPYGFTEVEYIEGAGNSYINLGLLPKTTHSFSSKFIVTDKSSANNMVMGTRGTGNFDTSRNQIYMNRQKVDKQVVLRNIYNVNDVKLTEGSDGYYSFDNVKNANAVLEGTTIPYYLFAINKLGVADAIANLKMYYFTIKDNGKVVCDLVPCIRESDGVAGMYDMIGGKFYKSETETEFNSGRKVIVRLPEEYQEVEYIEIVGDSYIDTKIVPTATMNCKVKFQPNVTTKQAHSLFGSRTLISPTATDVKTSFCCWLGYCTINKTGANNFRCDDQYGRGMTLIDTTNYITAGQDSIVEFGKKGFYINGSLVSSHSNLTISGAVESIYIGKIHQNIETATGSYYADKVKYYEFSIIEPTGFKMYLIPCIRKKDGIAGMYDTIGKKFYKSETSTEFVAGPIASGEQLEFVSNDNLNYIDTGLKLTSNHSVKLDYQYLQYNSGIFYGGRGKNTDISKPSTETSPAYIIGVANDSENENFDVCETYTGQKRYQQAFNTERRTVEMDNSKIAINGTTKKSFPKEVFESKVNAYIFSNPYCLVGSETKPGIVRSKVYLLTVKDNKSQVLQTLLPCKINGEIGLLDTVSKVFFTGELYGKPFVSNDVSSLNLEDEGE